MTSPSRFSPMGEDRAGGDPSSSLRSRVCTLPRNITHVEIRPHPADQRLPRSDDESDFRPLRQVGDRLRRLADKGVRARPRGGRKA